MKQIWSAIGFFLLVTIMYFASKHEEQLPQSFKEKGINTIAYVTHYDTSQVAKTNRKAYVDVYNIYVSFYNKHAEMVPNWKIRVNPKARHRVGCFIKLRYLDDVFNRRFEKYDMNSFDSFDAAAAYADSLGINREQLKQLEQSQTHP